MSKKKYNSKPQKRRKKRRRGKKAKTIILLLLIAILAVIIGGFALLYVKYDISPFTILKYQKEAQEIVANSTEDDFRPNKASVVYSDNEDVIAKLYLEEESTYLSFDDIPKDVIHAFVSVEDRTFWENSGVDTKGIARVVINYVRSGGKTAHGASTITQQLARNIFLSHEKSLERKVKEIFIAQEMTKKYSKEQIMEFYCNICCFANAIYGIEDASQKYLGKPASELSLSEAAYLCSIPNRPEYYDPFDDPTTALTRRDKILGDMLECGYITQEECDEAMAEEIHVVSKSASKQEFHSYATSLAIKYATEYLMEYKYEFTFQYEFDNATEYEAYLENYNTVYAEAKHNLYTGGYTIYTSLNMDAMDKLQDILDEQLSWNSDTGESGIYNLQGALTVIDNETGKIIAGIGGRSQDATANMLSLNRTFQSYQQPGSSIKPLLTYTPALENGYTANSLLVDVDQSEAKGKSAEKIKEMEGEDIFLRTAVEKSKNGAVYWLTSHIGISKGMHALESMEFSKITADDYNLSSALGGFIHGVTTTEMASAYRTLANHGSFDSPDCILSILNGNGSEIYEVTDSKQIYDDDAADQMVDILKGVLTRGTASGINWYGSSKTEAMGKTGTTNDSRDGWFCGSTPYYTIAVWVGSDNNEPVRGLSGGNYPARIWKNAMISMISGLPSASFDLDVPPDLRYENSEEIMNQLTTEDPLEEDPLEGEAGEVLDPNIPNDSNAPENLPNTGNDDNTETGNTTGGTTIDGTINGGGNGGNTGGGTSIDGTINGGGNTGTTDPGNPDDATPPSSGGEE